MKTTIHLLPLAIIVALSVAHAEAGNTTKTTGNAPKTTGNAENDAGNTANTATNPSNATVKNPGHMKVVNTSGVVSNIAYFHMLYSFTAADFENPFENLLKLSFDQDMTENAKKRAEECPPQEERRITTTHNMTEFFIVSEIQKHNLTAMARKRLRKNEDDWPNVLPISRVVHAAFYTDQSDVAFDNATMDEREELGEAMNGYFSFGCDMADCKVDGKRKAIIVCQATRGVPPKKRIISKAEYEKRFGKVEGSSSQFLTGFLSVLITLLVNCLYE